MPAKFDPDTALKKDLLARYKRLAAENERLKTKNKDLSSEMLNMSNNLKTVAIAEAKREVQETQKRYDKIARELRSEIRRQEEEIAELRQTLEAKADGTSARTLVRAELSPGLRSDYPDLILYLDLIIDTRTLIWTGSRACGYMRDRTNSDTVYPLILEKERIDFGEEYEGERDGRLLIKGKPIQRGQTVPFFPDGRVSSDNGETYIIGQITPMIQGK